MANAGERLLDAAGRGFRVGGFGGIGVDGLAREAGLTSGAFYAHFRSKGAAFQAVVKAGIEGLAGSIQALREAEGANWVEAFVDLYLTDRRTTPLATSCALQSLTGDVTRADAATQAAYAAAFELVLQAMTEGEHALPRGRAMALLSLLSGAVTIARATGNGPLAQDLAAAVRDMALR